MKQTIYFTIYSFGHLVFYLFGPMNQLAIICKSSNFKALNSCEICFLLVDMEGARPSIFIFLNENLP